jgi:hypothetical protein
MKYAFAITVCLLATILCRGMPAWLRGGTLIGASYDE